MTALERVRTALQFLVGSSVPGLAVFDTEDAAFGSAIQCAVVIIPLDAAPAEGYPLSQQAVDQPFSISIFARGADPVAQIEQIDSLLYAAISDHPSLGGAVCWRWQGDRWEHSQMGDGSYALKRVIWQATYLTAMGRRI